ncbi:hypothetical protein [Rhodopila sp.]|uniref:hypothetical protein n=1 Tax=Rhodopila sp. TaxID=2480087 RepID=UPI003D148813
MIAKAFEPIATAVIIARCVCPMWSLTAAVLRERPAEDGFARWDRVHRRGMPPPLIEIAGVGGMSARSDRGHLIAVFGLVRYL